MSALVRSGVGEVAERDRLAARGGCRRVRQGEGIVVHQGSSDAVRIVGERTEMIWTSRLGVMTLAAGETVLARLDHKLFAPWSPELMDEADLIAVCADGTLTSTGSICGLSRPPTNRRAADSPGPAEEEAVARIDVVHVGDLRRPCPNRPHSVTNFVSSGASRVALA